MKKLSLMFGIVCMTLMMQACGDTSLFPIGPGDPVDPKDPGNGGSKSQLVGKEWQLASWNEGGGMEYQVPDGQVYTISFDENGQAHGTAFCNGYSGTYKAGDHNSLSMDAFITTDAFCGDESIEGFYLGSLQEARSYHVTDSTLTIYSGKVRMLTFVPHKTVGPEIPAKFEQVIGIQWELRYIQSTNSDDGTKKVEIVPDDQKFTLTFNAGTPGRFAGMANCNTYEGDYSAPDDFYVNIRNIAHTKKGCGVDPSLELAYFDALSQTYGYKAFLGPNGGLTLLNRNGSGSLFFIAK